MKMSKLSNQTNSQDPQAVNSRVFVGNLNTFQCSKTDVERMFQRYGRLVGISMHKGYAFVQFTNPFDARNACHGEDGRTILSQVLDVNMVAEPKPHQIGRKRQNVTKTGNDWDYYYDSYCASALFQATGPRPMKRQRLMSQQQQQQQQQNRSIGNGVNGNKLNAVVVHQQQQQQQAAAAAMAAMAAQAAAVQQGNMLPHQQHLVLHHQQNLLTNGTNVNNIVAAAAAAATCNGVTNNQNNHQQQQQQLVHSLSPGHLTNGVGGSINGVGNSGGICLQPTSSSVTSVGTISTTQANNNHTNLTNCEQISSLLCTNGQALQLHKHQQQNQQNFVLQMQQQQHQQQQQQQQQQIMGPFKVYSNPDTLICGNCRECFSDLGELLDHKKSYCKLRFTCKCEETALASKNPLPTTKLLCAVCKDAFINPWDLMVHAQAAHMVNIYELGNEETNNNLSGTLNSNIIGNGNISINGINNNNNNNISTKLNGDIENIELIQQNHQQLLTQSNQLHLPIQEQQQQQHQQQHQQQQHQQTDMSNSDIVCISHASNSSTTSDTEHIIEINGNGVDSPEDLNLKEEGGHTDDTSIDGRMSFTSPAPQSDDMKLNGSISSRDSSPAFETEPPRACIVHALSIEAAANPSNSPPTSLGMITTNLAISLTANGTTVSTQ